MRVLNPWAGCAFDRVFLLYHASQYRCVHCILALSSGPDCLCSQDRGRVLRVWSEDFRFPQGRPPPPAQESSIPPLQEDSDLPPQSPPSHPCCEDYWEDYWEDSPQEDIHLPPKRRFLLPTPPWRPILHPTPVAPILRRGPLLPTPAPTHPNSNPIPELLASLQAAKEEAIEMLASQPGWGKRWQ